MHTLKWTLFWIWMAVNVYGLYDASQIGFFGLVWMYLTFPVYMLGWLLLWMIESFLDEP